MSGIMFNYEYPKRIRAGFIGCGAHSFRNVYPTFDYAPVELVAVCDLQPESAEIYRKRFGADAAYTDYRAMLMRDDLDAIFVVLNYDQNNHPSYPKILPDIMKARIPVWCEKPLAFSSKEAEMLLDLENKYRASVLVSNKRYFFPVYEKAKQIVDSTPFGAAFSISGRYPLKLGPYIESVGGRPDIHWLLDICHPMSAIHFLMGDIEQLLFTEHQPSGNAQVLLRFTSGAIGTLNLTATQAKTSPYERFEIIGNQQNILIENGIRLSYYRGSLGSGEYGKISTFIGDDPSNGPVVWEPEFSLGQMYNKNIFLQGMVQSVNHFANAVLNGTKVTRGTLKDAVHLTKVFEAFKNPSGQWIPIS